ncbi:hypothetical protein BDY21DRAFT_337719 [Lineolata rhizophorae]|uniref:Uncharacterized protein n=1 Tax=Lineolata rhizophorae TaxID=578093 RepID=A0A6A6P8N9_9PEZI|nr:hypothetical protein BDY21DRAFT_337719 [Lineolata rhizophorae]
MVCGNGDCFCALARGRARSPGPTLSCSRHCQGRVQHDTEALGRATCDVGNSLQLDRTGTSTDNTLQQRGCVRFSPSRAFGPSKHKTSRPTNTVPSTQLIKYPPRHLRGGARSRNPKTPHRTSPSPATLIASPSYIPAADPGCSESPFSPSNRPSSLDGWHTFAANSLSPSASASPSTPPAHLAAGMPIQRRTNPATTAFAA